MDPSLMAASHCHASYVWFPHFSVRTTIDLVVSLKTKFVTSHKVWAVPAVPDASESGSFQRKTQPQAQHTATQHATGKISAELMWSCSGTDHEGKCSTQQTPVRSWIPYLGQTEAFVLGSQSSSDKGVTCEQVVEPRLLLFGSVLDPLWLCLWFSPVTSPLDPPPASAVRAAAWRDNECSSREREKRLLCSE